MDEIIEYLEKKIQACDELGGMQLEKFAFVVTLKKARKIAINYTHSSTQLKEKHKTDIDIKTYDDLCEAYPNNYFHRIDEENGVRKYFVDNILIKKENL